MSEKKKKSYHIQAALLSQPPAAASHADWIFKMNRMAT